MNHINNIFFKCLKHKLPNKINKPLMFYHVPKCAGTTLGVILSYLFKKQFRALGPLFENNDKGGKTGYDNFLNKLEDINKRKIDFIYGHVPFEINELIKSKFLTITTLRDPIERSISHYNWMLIRGFCSEEDNLQELYNKEKIPRNTIVNQFSGIGIKNKDTDQSLDLSYKNIIDNIDYVYKSTEINELFKFLISNYNLPNLFYQSYQVINKKKKINKKNLEIIKKNNNLDIQLYTKLIEDKIFDSKIEFINDLSEQKFFYSSPILKINNNNHNIFNKKKIEEIERMLLKNNFVIKEI